MNIWKKLTKPTYTIQPRVSKGHRSYYVYKKVWFKKTYEGEFATLGSADEWIFKQQNK